MLVWRVVKGLPWRRPGNSRMPRPGRRGGDASREIFASGNVRPPNPFQPRGRAGAFGTGSNGVNTDGTTQPRQSERLLPLRPPNGRGAAQCVPRASPGMRLGWPGFRPSLLPFWNFARGAGISHGLSVRGRHCVPSRPNKNGKSCSWPETSLDFGPLQPPQRMTASACSAC